MNEIQKVRFEIPAEDIDALNSATMAAVRDAKKLLKMQRDLVLFGPNRTSIQAGHPPSIQTLLMARDMFANSETYEEQAKWLTLLMSAVKTLEDRGLATSRAAGSIVTKLAEIQLKATKLNAELEKMGATQERMVRDLPLEELERVASGQPTAPE